jgi:WD40 repeat protein
LWGISKAAAEAKVAAAEVKVAAVGSARIFECQSTMTVDSAVNSVAFSPDGSKIAAAYSDAIQIFDAQTQGKIGSPLSGHSDR